MTEAEHIIEDDTGPDGRGWVKLHRQLLGSAVFMNEGLLKVWLWCLLKATHRTLWRPMQTGRGMTQVELRPGQFIFGRKIAAAELGMPESTVRNRIQRRVELGNVNAQPDTHCSIVTICNWQTYQEQTDAKGQATDRQRTTKGHIQEQKQHKEVPDKSAQPTTEHFTAWYNAYPRKVAKLDAHKRYAAAVARIASEKALTLDVAAADLLATTETFAAAVKGGDPKFIPYPASWLNAGQYLDDPKSWSTASNEQRTRTAGNSPARIRSGEYSDPSKYRPAEAPARG